MLIRRHLLLPLLSLFLYSCANTPTPKINVEQQSYQNYECGFELYIPESWTVVPEIPRGFEYIMKTQGYYGPKIKDLIKLILVNPDTKGLIHVACHKPPDYSYSNYLRSSREYPEAFCEAWEERRSWAEKHGAKLFEYDCHRLTPLGGQVFSTRITLGPDNGNFMNDGTLFAYGDNKDNLVIVDIGLSSFPDTYKVNSVPYLEVLESMQYSILIGHTKN